MRRYFPSYALTPTDAVTAEPWLYPSPDGHALLTLGEAWPHWDYNTAVQLQRSIKFEMSMVRGTCGLSREARLRVVASWHSDTTQLRGLAGSVELIGSGTTQCTLVATLPSAELGGTVRVRTQLLLGADSGARERLAAHLAGSVLWEDETSLRVEGSGSRFPVEVVDFGGTRYPPEAGWILIWDRDDLDVPVMAGVRLWVNAAHAAVVKAVQAQVPDVVDQHVRSAIKFDVARTLLLGALENGRFVATPDAFEDGTIGRELRRLITLYFGQESPSSLAARARTMPELFFAELQAKSALFHASAGG